MGWGYRYTGMDWICSIFPPDTGCAGWALATSRRSIRLEFDAPSTEWMRVEAKSVFKKGCAF